ncbi:MAG: hypothetical protein ISS45_05850 [Candidatus Omnitrophica bacterium]|nr:hypothetical protein [Candidatus Omnitrophota bacterium]
MIEIEFSPEKMTEWEKDRCAAILRLLILEIVHFNRYMRNVGNFVNVELQIKFK